MEVGAPHGSCGYGGHSHPKAKRRRRVDWEEALTRLSLFPPSNLLSPEGGGQPPSKEAWVMEATGSGRRSVEEDGEQRVDGKGKNETPYSRNQYCFTVCVFQALG